MREIIDDPTENSPDISSPDSSKKKKQKGANTKRHPGKPSTGELFWKIKEAVDHSPLSLMPVFPHDLRVYSGDIDTRLVVSVESDGVCVLVGEKHIAALVAKYLKESLVIDASHWIWTAKKAEDFAKFWTMNAEPIAEPKSWAFLSDPSLTFMRLSWDPTPGLPTPTWDDVLGRMSNAEAFKAFVGSLFIPNSYSQQYLWLHGPGGDGKGSIFRFLADCFGKSYAAETPPQTDNRFWASGLLHKRVVVFADCDASDIVRKDFFKSLTGGDFIRVEKKGKDAYTAKLEAKIIFGSNTLPAISPEKSDLRRLILCQMQTWEGGSDPTFERRLAAEASGFIAKCLATYRAVCPADDMIPTDTEDAEILSTHIDERYETLADSLFNFSPTLECTPLEFYSSVSSQLRNDYYIGKFKSYIRRVYGVEKRRLGKERREVYVGAAPKTLISRMASVADR